MKILKNTPNFLTMINLALGFLSIAYASTGNLDASAFMIFAAVLFDFLDGRVARKFRLETKFGAELDSLADLISFGVAPAILMHAYYQNIFLLLILIVFVGSAAYRLARFNLLKEEVKDFVGMPITVNGLIFPILYFSQASFQLTTIIFVVSLILMVSTYRFKKVI